MQKIGSRNGRIEQKDGQNEAAQGKYAIFKVKFKNFSMIPGHASLV